MKPDSYAVNPYRQRDSSLWGPLASDDDIGNCGLFLVPSPEKAARTLRVIASDGPTWEHVSISVNGQPSKIPSWEEMCRIKDLFWNEEETVIQIHPPKSVYVNYHPGTLHLWKKIGFEQPLPDPAMVGPRR